MRIDENDKKDILSKYVDDTSNELLTYLKRHYPVYISNSEWIRDMGIDPNKFILVGDKTYTLSGNKKFLVNKIFNDLEDHWISLGDQKVRRTIKKYLDGILSKF